MAIVALALPASASADLVVSQTASPKPVKKGELVTITVLGKGYKLTIQATRKGGHALKRTVTFELCG